MWKVFGLIVFAAIFDTGFANFSNFDGREPQVAPILIADDFSDRVPEDQHPTGQFTTATEIKPILDITKASWIAVRLYEGQDLLYFTHLLSWRCGLWDIRYGINGAPAETSFPTEACHEGTSTPNAMSDIENFLPYVSFDAKSIDSVTIELFYDDGTMDSAEFVREAVLIQ